MHSILKRSFPTSMTQKEIMAEINEIVEAESDSGSLYFPIKWIDRNFGSRQEAETYINSIDTDYGQFAVKYTEPVQSKKLKELTKKVYEARSKYNAESSVLHASKVTSDFIGCKKCGSKLARKYIKSNRCPLCGEDMRSNTELKKVAALAAAVDAAQTALAQETRNQARKGGKEMWLVKIEFHC